MTVSRKIAALLILVLASGLAHANLITNGGFENYSVDDGKWRFFVADNINSWSGSNIEVWDSLNGVHAFEGENHAELNAHPFTGDVFKIYQSFATVVGARYDLSFAYRARVNNNEEFTVDVVSGVDNVFTSLVSDHTTSAWTVFAGSFLATNVETVLSFTSVTPATSTLGNFIDDVSVTTDTLSTVNVSAPSAFVFMLLSVIFVALRRTR